MKIDPVPQIIIAIIALFLSAVFTMFKYSYEDLNKVKLENWRKDGDISEKEERDLSHIVDKLNNVQSIFMISDYISNATVAVSLGKVGYMYFSTTGIIISVLISTILILVFGESAPYFITVSKGDHLAVKYYKFTKIYTKILAPFAIIIRSISMGIGSLFGGEKEITEPKITEDELFTAMNLSKDEGLLDLDEYGMIEKVFAFSDTYVKDVMTPRTNVVAVDVESSLDEIVNTFTEEGYSRVPVYKGEIDEVIGVLHIKDLLPFVANEEELNIREVLRKPIYTFEYQKTSDLFNQMRKNNGTFAIVLDEYGGTEGIVSLEDLIEEIVGEIEDEYDGEDFENEIIPLKNNSYIIDGIVRLDDFYEQTGIELYSDEVDTIGGYALEIFDRIPEQGEVIKDDNKVFTVLEIDKNRISKLKLQIT